MSRIWAVATLGVMIWSLKVREPPSDVASATPSHEPMQGAIRSVPITRRFP
jgi:hypothetical protein